MRLLKAGDIVYDFLNKKATYKLINYTITVGGLKLWSVRRVWLNRKGNVSSEGIDITLRTEQYMRLYRKPREFHPPKWMIRMFHFLKPVKHESSYQ